MPSPYDDGWLDMRDVELQLNDPRTKSLTLADVKQALATGRDERRAAERIAYNQRVRR